MSRNRKTGQQKSKRRATKRPRARKNNTKSKAGKRRRGPKLNPMATAYRRLIMDPCHAYMVSPPSTTSESGYLIRTRSVVTFPSVAATNTTWGVYYHPGLQQYYQFELPNSTTAIASGSIVTTQATANPTGLYTQLTTGPLFNTSYSCRPVASCLTYSYAGSESNRSGTLCYSNAISVEQFFDAVAAGSATGNNFDVWCSKNMRVPVSSLDLKWKPDMSADQFEDTLAAISTVSPTGSSAQLYPVHMSMANGMLFVVNSGSNASNQERVEITTVWEWKPNTGTGIAAAAPAPSYHGLTLRDIVDTIPEGALQEVVGYTKNAMSQMAANMMVGTINAYTAGRAFNLLR